jgi:hypothetical protein
MMKIDIERLSGWRSPIAIIILWYVIRLGRSGDFLMGIVLGVVGTLSAMYLAGS